MMSTRSAFPLAAALVATNSCPLGLRPPPGLAPVAAARDCSKTLRRRRLRALHRERSNDLVHQLTLELQRVGEVLQRATRETQAVEAIVQAALYHADEERNLAKQQAEEQRSLIAGLEARLAEGATIQGSNKSSSDGDADRPGVELHKDKQGDAIAADCWPGSEATARLQVQEAQITESDGNPAAGSHRNPIDVIYDLLADIGTKKQWVGLKQGASALKKIGNVNVNVARAALQQMEQLGMIQFDAKRRRMRLLLM